MDQESGTEKKFHPVVAGIFFVTEKEIINVRNFNTDNGPICLYELDEENMLSAEHGFPVCDTEPRDTIEWNVDWRITIHQDNDYVVTDIKIANDYYETYVWENDEGLVGYQYGKYVGGDQHDFFTDEYILENYLHRGWE